MLEIKNIHKSFNDREVLKGINLTVKKGDVIGIIGPSGCENRQCLDVSINWKLLRMVKYYLKEEIFYIVRTYLT